MKSASLISAAIVTSLLCSCNHTPKSPIELADPMVGTGFHGHTFPGATVPHGAVQLSPDTRMGNWDACSGYHYSDSTLDGFSHTHLSGTGCIDLGDILIRPTVGSNAPIPFDHKNETASPGYYSVQLPSIGVDAELTATTRAGLHRYSYAEGQRPVLTIDLAHSLDNETIDSLWMVQVAPDMIMGLRATSCWTPGQHAYFAARFSAPIDSSVIAPDGSTASLYFAPDASPLTVAVGLSQVSADGALSNLNAEVPTLDFDSVAAAARARWAEALDVITVEGGSEEQQRNFYTALYHTLLTPNVVNDVDGRWRRHDESIDSLAAGNSRYSTLSLWDTYRALHPLLTITDTTLVADIIGSMLDIYDTTGELPIWPLASGETSTMIGYHSAAVISEAWLKGIRGFDPHRALKAMMASSDRNAKGSAEYVATGWIPSNRKRESVSCTLEYAYDDWCIARMAEELGLTDVANKYYARARNYENVFDGSTRFFRARRDDGNWEQPFDPSVVGRAYTEATAWHYRFSVPHDVAGMIDQFGGIEPFTAALDSIFDGAPVSDIDLVDITGLIGAYAHGNEPSHHIAYLYDYVGQPWRTQELTRRLLDEMYAPTPEGIIGNEDCGQMSAWYILSALGFYPVSPASGEYALTTPLFERATVRLAGDRMLTVEAPGAPEKRYVKSVTFNGQPVAGNFISHEQLMQGGTLHFDLSSAPVRDNTLVEAGAHSMTADRAVSRPYVEEDLYLFIDSTRATIGCATPDATIRYTIDGSEPTEESAIYTGPIPVDRSLTLRARAYKEGLAPSSALTLSATKAEYIPAHKVESKRNGVAWTYTEGVFKNVEEMSASPVKARGTMPVPDISAAPSEDHFGYIFSGWINVPADGVYTFMTRSDDGSVLEIDGRRVVDNNGSHAAIPATGQVALAAGMHPFTLRYFEDYEGQALSWGWCVPGSDAIESIPAERLFY